jgi:hypothetical protein
MAKDKGNFQSRRAAASMADVQQLIQNGAYSQAPLQPFGYQSMPASRPSIGEGTWTGNPVGAIVNTNLPDNVYGPQLPDLRMSVNRAADAETRRFRGTSSNETYLDDQNLKRAQMMYDANEGIAAAGLNDYPRGPQDTIDMAGTQLVPNEFIRQYLNERINARRGGGSQPPIPDNYTPRR